MDQIIIPDVNTNKDNDDSYYVYDDIEIYGPF